MSARHASERRAALHYRLRGYRILGANVWAAGYELDLVLRRGRTLVFCEVKSRRDAGFGRAVEMVGPEKVRRVRRAAEAWLLGRPDLRRLRIRFDVVAEQDGRIERVSRAF